MAIAQFKFGPSGTSSFDSGSFKQHYFNLVKIQELHLNLHTIRNIWGDSNSPNQVLAN